MIRRGISGSNNGETLRLANRGGSLRRRIVESTPVMSNERQRLNTTRLSTILLVIVGVFGWVQWIIAVTHIQNEDTVVGGSMRTRMMSSFLHSPEQRPLVHQIQLNDKLVASPKHRLPKKDVFEKDWLGKNVNATATGSSTCVPMHSWQLPENAPYSCNLIHELPYDNAHKVGCGNDRCVVAIQDMQGHDVALKTMRSVCALIVNELLCIFTTSHFVFFSSCSEIKSRYDEDDYHAGWMDAVVTERLSSSPLVVNQFANCGLSQILELGNEGVLMDHIILAQRNGEYMSSITRLKIAHQVAASLSDLHSIDGTNIPSVSHNDLCSRQFLPNFDDFYDNLE